MVSIFAISILYLLLIHYNFYMQNIEILAALILSTSHFTIRPQL